MIDLKPCPFCGNTELSISYDVVMPDDWHSAQVVCGYCEMTGPSSVSGEEGEWADNKSEAKDMAINIWNQRVNNV